MRALWVAGLAGMIMLSGCVSRQSVKIVEGPHRRKGRIEYRGGEGGSYEDAVVIVGAQTREEGMAAGYEFISRQCGKKGKDWKVRGQVVSREGDKVYDIIEIKLTNSELPRYYYFDISGVSWRPEE